MRVPVPCEGEIMTGDGAVVSRRVGNVQGMLMGGRDKETITGNHAATGRNRHGIAQRC